MKQLLFITLAMLQFGCLFPGNYGKIAPMGTVLDCDRFTVASFEEKLRSSPNAFGPGTYVGYLDFGPGMSREPVFLVLPLRTGEKNDLGSALVASDPKKRTFWSAGKVLSGSLAEKAFVCFIPGEWTGDDRFRNYTRSDFVIQGNVIASQGQSYLVMSQMEGFVKKPSEGPMAAVPPGLKKYHAEFLNAVQFSVH